MSFSAIKRISGEKKVPVFRLQTKKSWKRDELPRKALRPMCYGRGHAQPISTGTAPKKNQWTITSLRVARACPSAISMTQIFTPLFILHVLNIIVIYSRSFVLNILEIDYFFVGFSEMI